MKYKIILLIGFLLIVCVFAIFIQRRTYYSNSGEKVMTEKFFDLYCALDKSNANEQKLEINFDLHEMVDRQTLEELTVIPISNNEDTLKMIGEHVGKQYTFRFPGSKNKKLDLTIDYKTDSAGFKMNKSIKYYNMEKTYTYHLRSPF